jgi:P-type Mg2+ transporter
MAVFSSDIPDAWWVFDNRTLLGKLASHEKGLSVEEAHRRLGRFGLNELAKRERQSLVARIITKLVNPLILILLFAGLLSAILGQITDFMVILTMTLLSVALDTFQEHSAELASDKLQKSVSLTATVLHDGVKKEVLFSRVVPGDIIFLSSGDIVPADGKLLNAFDLTVDQSTLTGESYPQHKKSDVDVGAAAAVSDRVNCVFMGTHVISGEGTMAVVATASDTQLGKIAKSLVGDREKTEFERGIADYGLLLMKLVMILGPVVFVSHVFLRHDILSSLLFVLALAVGFAPELLPLVVTINLSKGAIRMSHKGVIVKRLPAIENFGSMDVLCTDKTGTLTENAIKLVLYEDVHGKVDEEVLKLGYLVSSFQTSVSSPIEHATLARGSKIPVSSYKKLFELPFDFYRKSMSVVVARKHATMLITKGAPESILIHASHVEEGGRAVPLTADMKKAALKRFETLSSSGYRVIAVAYRSIAKARKYKTTDEVDLTLVGFLSFLDPPKKTTRAALQLLEHRGVALKILTGDNELVTKKVCEELGLTVSGIAVGSDIDRLDDEALMHVVDSTTIFARLTPEAKKRVIEALRRRGHVVGYLGDGVNDAPSLRASDIGISVNNAVDVAKESADIILLHKDLHVLHDGVLEGRRTFANVMKYIKMGTSSNFGNMVSVGIASLFLPFLPMLPVQILFNDLLYDMSQLFVASDSVDAPVIAKPRKWDIKAIRRFMLAFGLISSVFDCITFAFLLWFFKATPAFFQTGWFLESIVTQTLIIFSIRTALVPFFRSRPSPVFALGLYGVVALALLVPLSPLASWFSFVVPPVRFYILLAGIVVCYFSIVESVKVWFYKRYSI